MLKHTRVACGDGIAVAFLLIFGVLIHSGYGPNIAEESAPYYLAVGRGSMLPHGRHSSTTDGWGRWGSLPRENWRAPLEYFNRASRGRSRA